MSEAGPTLFTVIEKAPKACVTASLNLGASLEGLSKGEPDLRTATRLSEAQAEHAQRLAGALFRFDLIEATRANAAATIAYYGLFFARQDVADAQEALLVA